MKEFHLGHFYYLNDSQSIAHQLHALSSVIQALIPFCVGAYDGHHWFNHCCYFATGFLNPNSSLLLNQAHFEFFCDIKRAHFEECEVFCHQTFQVTIDQTPTSHDLKVAYNIMIKLGGQKTTSQELSIKTDWQCTIGEFLTHLQGNQNTLNKLRGFTLDNFWNVETWNLPHNYIINNLIDFIETHERHKGI